MKTQVDLLKSIHTEHQSLQLTLAGLSNEQLTGPGAVASWSVKDTLAHITAWEQRLLCWLAAALGGETPDLAPPYGMPDHALDKLNEQIYQQHRDRPLPGVLADFEASFDQTIAAVAAVPEELLFTAGRFELPEGTALWEIIAANSCWHYQEHYQDFQTWLARD